MALLTPETDEWLDCLYQVTEHYKRSSQAFHDNPLITPSLVFYSKADPIGIPGPIEVSSSSS